MKAAPISILQDIENDDDKVVGKKYNGFSEILVVKDGVVHLFNRSGSEQTENVPHITKVAVPKSTDLVIAGEGYAPSGRLEDAKSIFGSYPEHAVKVQKTKGLALFTAINITRYAGEDLTHISFGERIPVLCKAVVDLQGCRMPIEIELLINRSKKYAFNYIVSRGGEGVVVKSLKGFEKDWFKVKRLHSWDVIIAGFTEGKGKYASVIGAIRYGAYDDDGKLTEVGKCSGMTDAERGVFASTPETFIGRVIEIQGQEIGNQGRVVFPRFIRLRDDKPPMECLLRDLTSQTEQVG